MLHDRITAKKKREEIFFAWFLIIICFFIVVYNDSKNVETTLNNGTKIYKLKNGQIEKNFPDGTKLIIFNDETEKYIYNDGSEETYFSDGFVQKDKNKDIIIEKTLEEDNYL